MSISELCPELHYRLISAGVVLTACCGTDGRILLPDEIGGRPVTAIAPYAFAGGDGGGGPEDLVWLSEGAELAPERRRLGAEDITEVYLPRYVREIGNYAFYRCRNMRRLSLHDALPAIGGGALAGCRLRELEIHLHTGEKSALKSVLDEIRYEVRVRFCRDNGPVSEVLFPEHYEEAVENTPARILYTSHHGAGGYYRQCFYDRELDYKRYDGLLPWVVAEEEEETAARLSLLRLYYPYKLSEEAANAYREYIGGHREAALRVLIEDEDTGKLAFLAEGGLLTGEALDYGIGYAGKLGKTEILSILMDERHKRFPKKRKTFDL